jgi:hypothetical protein
MSLKERIVGALSYVKEQAVKAWSYSKEQAMNTWEWVAQQAKTVETSISNLVSTEPGFEISKRVISSMPQAAITVIAIQMAMVGAGIGMVSITMLVSMFFVSAIWATKARNEALIAKA